MWKMKTTKHVEDINIRKMAGLKIKGKKIERKKVKKKWIIAGITVILLIIVLIILFQKKNPASGQTMRIQTANVETGTVSNTIVGTGTLELDVSEEIKIPSEIIIEEVNVESGDHVSKGDVLAKVDEASVLDAMGNIQDEIANLDEEITDCKNGTDTETIKATVSGTVAKIYGKSGENALDSIADHGAVLTITASDTGETIEITDGTGIISSIGVSTGETVSVGDTLYKISNDEDSEKYKQLISERKELTSLVKELASLAKTGKIKATQDGILGSVNVEGTGSKTTDSSSSGSNTTAGSSNVSSTNASITPANAISLSTMSMTGNMTASTVAMVLGSESTVSSEEETSSSTKTEDTTQETEPTTQNEESTTQTTIQGKQETTTQEKQESTTQKKQETTTQKQQNTAPSGNSGSGTAKTGGGTSTTTTGSQSGSTTDSSSETTVVGITLTTAFTFASEDTICITVNVDELDINSVSVDQEAEITMDAIENETFTGTVTKVNQIADNSTSGSGKYVVTISMQKDENMKAGMNASATIVVEKKENVLTIPVNALQERKGSTFVYTKQESDGTLSGETEVTTGLSDGNTVEILEGISEGDTVYYQKSGNISSGGSGTVDKNMGEYGVFVRNSGDGGGRDGMKSAPSGAPGQGGF